MSKTNVVPVSTSKFSIVQKIMEALKLGDDGKLDSFFTRIEKTLTREITALEKNVENNKFNSKSDTERLEDKLEDAQQRLAEAYMAVEPDNVSNNERAASFMDSYLEGITRSEKAVKVIEDAIKDEATDLEDKNIDLTDQIELLKRRIASISK